jgi:Holliday junction DNA helicase RuvA
MRDRLDRIEPVSGVSLPRTQSAGLVVETPQSDALGALIALGYKPNDASRMVRSVECEDLSSEEIIRLALRAVVTKS